MKKIVIVSFLFFMFFSIAAQDYEVYYQVGTSNTSDSGSGRWVYLYIEGPFGTIGLNNGPGYAYAGYSGTITVTGRPTAIKASGTCYIEGTVYPWNSAPYVIGYLNTSNPYSSCASSAGFSVSANIRMLPIMTLTGNPAVSPSPKVICDNASVFLTAPAGFPVYSWQFSTDGGTTWQGVSGTTNTRYLTADLSKIGLTNANKNIYFRCDGSYSGITTSTANPPIGPYVFRAVPPSITGYTATQPTCHGGTNGQIVITGLSRALNVDETVQFQLTDSDGNVSLSEQANSSTYTIDGGSSLQSPFGIKPGNCTIVTRLYASGNKVTCTTISRNIVLLDRTIITNSPAITKTVQCYNSSTGEITVTASGGSGSLEFSKDGTNFQTSNVFSSLPKGNYQITVRDAADHTCYVTSSTLTLANPPDINITTQPYVSSDYNGSDISCVGSTDGKITLAASGGTGSLQYTRTGGTYQSSSTFTNVGAGSYIVTVRDANNCTKNSSNVTLSAPTAITATATPTNALCNGGTGSFVVNASGGSGALSYKANLSPFLSFQPSNVFSNAPPNTYTVTIKDANACQITKSVTVSQPSAISISLTPTDVTCSGGSDGTLTVSASNGVGAYNYALDATSFQTSNKFTGLSTGTYTVTVKDANGCTNNASKLVGTNSPINGLIGVSQTIRCKGESNGALDLTPSGGVSPYTYQWSNGETTQDITNIPAGFYSVTITDNKSCQKTFNYTLGEPTVLTAAGIISNFNGYGVSCSGSLNGSVDLTPSGGTAPYIYAWSTGATSQDVSGIGAGQYDVTVTDNKGCTTLKSFNLTTPSQITLSNSNTNISCSGGSNGAIALTGSGGTESFEYSINSTSSWVTSSNFTNLTAGSYTMRIRDSNGCQKTLSTSLTAPPLLAITITDQQNTTCGDSNGSATVAASGGVANYVYKWFNSSNVQVGNSNNISNLNAGIYRIDVTDQNGCLKQKNVSISSSNGPAVNISSITPVTCYESTDGTATISVTLGQAPYQILWPTGETTTIGTGLSRGDQIVEVSDASGCQVYETIPIPYPDPIDLQTIQQQDPTCFGFSNGAIEINAQGGNGGFAYNWSNGATGSILQNLPAGNYSMTATDAKGCNLSKQFTLMDPQLFTIDLGADIEMCEGQTITISPEAENATFEWTSDNGFTSNDQQISVNKPGHYILFATNDKGCEAEDQVELIINKDLLKTDFLMATEAHVGDTVVVIDISWPLPENVSWNFGADAQVIYNGFDWAMLSFDAVGTYTIGLSAQLATCAGYHDQTITILEREVEGGRAAQAGLIKEAILFPNPSEGKFNITLELNEVSDANIQLVSLSGNRTLFEDTLKNDSHYERYYNFEHLQSGIYFLFIKAGKESRVIRFVVI